MNPIMKQRLSLAAGIQLSMQLHRTMCSAAWLNAILQPTPRNDAWQFLVGQFPPGQNKTKMRECSTCRRIGPPNDRKTQCVDCEIERQQRDVREAIIDAECEVVSPNIAQRHWRHNVTYSDLVYDPYGVFEKLEPPGDPGADVTSIVNPKRAFDANEMVEASSKPRQVNRREQLQWLIHRLGLPASRIQFYDPIPKSSLSGLPQKIASEVHAIATDHDRSAAENMQALRHAFRKACKPLGDFRIRCFRKSVILKYAGQQYCLIRCQREFRTRNVSQGTGRAASCQATMLPDDTELLKREIAYFEERGKIIPTAQRFSQCNPFMAAPEDHLKVKDCFVSRKPGSGGGSQSR